MELSIKNKEIIANLIKQLTGVNNLIFKHFRLGTEKGLKLLSGKGVGIETIIKTQQESGLDFTGQIGSDFLKYDLPS